jgi:UDP-N-acetylmuramoylalanine--D-glutamate ligase
LFDLPEMKPGDLVLLELSSFMLYYLSEMAWSPHVALLTMLSSDHVEWHGTQEAYLDAKKTLVKFQKPGDFAVLDETNEIAKSFAAATAAQIVWYGLHGRKQFELALPGRHNQFNAQAAFAAAGVMGVTFDEAQSAVRHFVGLPHRLELVHTAGGVRYFNDSIATIPDAASAALESFEPGKVIQIVGGHDKGLPFAALCHTLAKNTKATLCIGETSGKIAGMLRELHPEFSRFVYECGTLESAMHQAKAIAEEGDVVLLSTGCSSYDQFRNFEQRGELFAQLARGA